MIEVKKKTNRVKKRKKTNQLVRKDKIVEQGQHHGRNNLQETDRSTYDSPCRHFTKHVEGREGKRT
jgi:hypothetical protein